MITDIQFYNFTTNKQWVEERLPVLKATLNPKSSEAPLQINYFLVILSRNIIYYVNNEKVLL